MLTIFIVLGTLTQYYYILFLLGFSIVFMIRYIRKRQIKNLAKFISVIILSQVIVYIIFPNYIQQLQGNSQRSIRNDISIIEKIQTMAEREKTYTSILFNNMFNFNIKYLLVTMLIIGVIMCIIKVIKNPRQKIKINKKLKLILVPTLVYWLLVTLTSPYVDLRYILPLFVFILIIIIFLFKKELEIIIKNKKIVMIIILIVSLIYSVSLFNSAELRYQYKDSKEKIRNISNYSNIPCIYMYAPSDDVLTNTFTMNLNYVRQFENVYVMNKINFTINDLRKALEGKDISKGIIIIDNEVNREKTLNKIIEQMEEFNNYKRIEEITIERKIYNEIYLVYK